MLNVLSNASSNLVKEKNSLQQQLLKARHPFQMVEEIRRDSDLLLLVLALRDLF